ncbi:hypothetical protein KC945_01505 [Candidatus Saccharibacteria bacterium]|nr:hypothetical protein [Candidatus Saccharibacteria bacterium]
MSCRLGLEILFRLTKVSKRNAIATILSVAIVSLTSSSSYAMRLEFAGLHLQASKYSGAVSSLKSLVAWNNNIYAGYGDINRSIGPIYVSPYIPKI